MNPWWPSRYGADDDAGALNKITPFTVVDAARLVRSGRVYDLDVNCRMHEVDNLYLADSSFFVSGSAVNSRLTIIANALRVADHLA